MLQRLRSTLTFAHTDVPTRSHMVGGIAVAAILTAAMGTSGCGSSSNKSSSNKSSSNSTPTALSKAQFLAKGNAICDKGNKHKASVAGIQAQINQVRALGAPPGDEATVSMMLDTAQADLDKVKSNPALLTNTKVNTFGDFAKLAHPYGLTSCAPDS